MEKTEISGIYRSDNGALINKNNSELNSYKRKKEDIKTINSLKSDVEHLKNRVALLEAFIVSDEKYAQFLLTHPRIALIK